MGVWLALSWLITVLVSAFAVWLFLRYGRLVARMAELERESLPVPGRHRYDIAISLGYTCQIAHQLINHGNRSEALPFDWLVTPFDALYHLLDRDFEGFLKKDDLAAEFVRSPAGAIEECMRNSLGVQFFHDFPHGDSALSAFPEVKKKYGRRIQRLREILRSNQRVALLRFPLSRDEARELRDLIRRKYPRLDFTLVALNEPQDGDEDWTLTNVKCFRVPHTQDWQGDDEAYRDVLAQLDIATLEESVRSLP